jgi:hypothetical protein
VEDLDARAEWTAENSALGHRTNPLPREKVAGMLALSQEDS